MKKWHPKGTYLTTQSKMKLGEKATSRWSDDDIHLLVNMWLATNVEGHFLYSIRTIGKKLGRRDKSVQTMLNKISGYRPDRRRFYKFYPTSRHNSRDDRNRKGWSSRDLHFLRRLLDGGNSYGYISAILMRSPTSIKGKDQELKTSRISPRLQQIPNAIRKKSKEEKKVELVRFDPAILRQVLLQVCEELTKHPFTASKQGECSCKH